MPPIGFIDDEEQHQGVLGLGLGGFRDIWGRAAQAIPTGLVLPEAKRGVTPYTYSIPAADLPGTGITFTAATRTLSGTPAVSGDHTINYTVTDADGATATKTFNWHVYDSTHALQLGDFDDGKFGYGLSDHDPTLAMVLESGNDAAFASVNLFRRQPAGNNVGHVRHDNQAKDTFPGGAFLSRHWWRGERNPPRTALFHSEEDSDGNAVAFDWNAWFADNPAAELYLQADPGAIGVEYGTPTASGTAWAAWNQTTGTQAAWIRANMNDNDRFLLVIA